ncbi:hypothetical protein ACFW08_16425 [Streptomyces sp. NPDC058960]|uniref:hypothetical protein n=1 Tax=Streptomyces sp. NPDC058960 TaxID=3346679 RepID=UPI0036947F4E
MLITEDRSPFEATERLLERGELINVDQHPLTPERLHHDRSPVAQREPVTR